RATANTMRPLKKGPNGTNSQIGVTETNSGGPAHCDNQCEEPNGTSEAVNVESIEKERRSKKKNDDDRNRGNGANGRVSGQRRRSGEGQSNGPRHDNWPSSSGPLKRPNDYDDYEDRKDGEQANALPHQKHSGKP